jgi:hypothetical protein
MVAAVIAGAVAVAIVAVAVKRQQVVRMSFGLIA